MYTTLDTKLNTATPLNGYAGKSSENFQKVQLLQLFCLSTCHVYAVCVCVCVCQAGINLKGRGFGVAKYQ